MHSFQPLIFIKKNKLDGIYIRLTIKNYLFLTGLVLTNKFCRFVVKECRHTFLEKTLRTQIKVRGRRSSQMIIYYCLNL